MSGDQVIKIEESNYSTHNNLAPDNVLSEEGNKLKESEKSETIHEKKPLINDDLSIEQRNEEKNIPESYRSHCVDEYQEKPKNEDSDQSQELNNEHVEGDKQFTFHQSDQELQILDIQNDHKKKTLIETHDNNDSKQHHLQNRSQLSPKSHELNNEHVEGDKQFTFHQSDQELQILDIQNDHKKKTLIETHDNNDSKQHHLQNRSQLSPKSHELNNEHVEGDKQFTFHQQDQELLILDTIKNEINNDSFCKHDSPETYLELTDHKELINLGNDNKILNISNDLQKKAHIEKQGNNDLNHQLQDRSQLLPRTKDILGQSPLIAKSKIQRKKTSLSQQSKSISELPEDEQIQHLIKKYRKAYDQSDLDMEKRIINGTIQQLRSRQIKRITPKKIDNPSPKPQNPKDQVRQNLQEIYQFYAKQTLPNGNSSTFDKLLHNNNIMSLGKYMYFCKDFKIIDLKLEIQHVIMILQQQGLVVAEIPHPVQKKQSKFSLSRRDTVDKSILVEFFKKSSANGLELSFNEFELSLSKIATFAYQNILDMLEVPDQGKPNALILFLFFLQVQTKSDYRKKMLIVRTPFAMKDGIVEKLNFDQLKRKLPQILKSQSKIDPQSTILDEDKEVQVDTAYFDDEKFQSPKKKVDKTKVVKSPKKIQRQNSGEQVTWDNLTQLKIDDYGGTFDPRDLLEEMDLNDQDDEIYLAEYNMNKNYQDSQIIVIKDETSQHSQLKKIPANKISDKKLSSERAGYLGKSNHNQGQVRKLNISQDKTQQLDLSRNTSKIDSYQARRRSTHQDPYMIVQETQTRALQLEMQQIQHEQDLYQKLFNNQNQRERKMISKS